MFAFAAGTSPAHKNCAIAARAAAALLFAALGGCASSQNSAQYQASNAHVAQVVTEVEDDGLPAQTPPPARIRDTPDNPAEPFSRNYGGANPSASAAPQPEAPARAPAPQIPADLPPSFRQKLAAAMSVDE
jgi:hypothetical protein